MTTESKGCLPGEPVWGISSVCYCQRGKIGLPGDVCKEYSSRPRAGPELSQPEG